MEMYKRYEEITSEFLEAPPSEVSCFVAYILHSIIIYQYFNINQS